MAPRLEDIARESYANDQSLDPYLREILSGRAGLPQDSSPDDLLRRYSTVFNAREAGNQQSKNAALYTQGIYGDLDNLNQYAYDTFRTTFGRDPSSTEFAQLLPVFGGAEGRQRGAAYVSQLYDQYKQSPEYIGSQSPRYADDIGGIYQDVLGRGARSDEQDYYGRMLAAGRSPYEIRQMLEGSQEYQSGQDTKFRGDLASELEGYDTSFFNKQKEGIIGDYARRGLSQSPSLDYALTNMMGEIAEKRGSYLAGISSQQYGGNKAAARSDYETNRNRYFSDQDYDRNRKTAELDYYRGRSDMDRDYERQKEDYYQQIARGNQGRDVLHSGDWINLGLQGINTGARAYMASQSGGGGYSSPYSYLDY